MEFLDVAGCQPRHGIRRRRCDRVEDAEQRVGEALRVAGDQFGIVEVIAGIHLHARIEAATHVDLALLVEQRHLDAINLGGVGIDDADRRIHRDIEIAGAPIILQRRIEHVAEPVNDHGFPHLRQDAIVDPGVVVGVATNFRECARRHQDDLAAGLFDGLDLLFIGADHVIDRFGVFRREVIGAGAGGHQRTAARLGRLDRALDQFQRCRPVQSHAALCGVHGFRDAKAEIPDMFAESDGLVPVDRGGQPGIDVGAWIGHHMGGRIHHAIELALEFSRKGLGHGRMIGLQRAVGARQLQRQPRDRRRVLVHDNLPQALMAGTSIQRRSRQLCSAHSTNCTPLAPSSSVYL